MKKSGSLTLCVICLISLMSYSNSFAQLFVALPTQPCNGKTAKAPASGAKCGAGTTCPPPVFPGPNSCLGETLVQQTAQDDCSGTGTTSQGCYMNGPTYNCTKRFKSKLVWIPNPDNPGFWIESCDQGTYIGVGSTKKKGVNITPCDETI